MSKKESDRDSGSSRKKIWGMRLQFLSLLFVWLAVWTAIVGYPTLFRSVDSLAQLIQGNFTSDSLPLKVPREWNPPAEQADDATAKKPNDIERAAEALKNKIKQRTNR